MAVLLITILVCAVVSSDIKEEKHVITAQNVQLPKSYLGDEQFPRENESAPLEGWFYADKTDLIAAIVNSYDDVQVLSHREIRDGDKVWTSLRLYGPYVEQVELCRFELTSHVKNSHQYHEALAEEARAY